LLRNGPGDFLVTLLKPDARVITCQELLEWLQRSRDLALGETILVEIRQHVPESQGRLIGAEVGEVNSGRLS
jgi:hypothetical protein